jgi:hypothetical protein
MMTDHTHDKTAPAPSDESRPHGWLHVLRARLGFAMPQSVRDALEGALRADASTSFTDAERKMLERLLRFGASRVAALMVPRADIIALDENEPISELLKPSTGRRVALPLSGNARSPGAVHIKTFHWLMSEQPVSRADRNSDGATETPPPRLDRTLDQPAHNDGEIRRPGSLRAADARRRPHPNAVDAHSRRSSSIVERTAS